ncbi:MAG: hypothetical protein CEO22_477, partial [Candidatus Berkelbacteria bacterium Gr01-1014_85]
LQADAAQLQRLIERDPSLGQAVQDLVTRLQQEPILAIKPTIATDENQTSTSSELISEKAATVLLPVEVETSDLGTVFEKLETALGELLVSNISNGDKYLVKMITEHASKLRTTWENFSGLDPERLVDDDDLFRSILTTIPINLSLLAVSPENIDKVLGCIAHLAIIQRSIIFRLAHEKDTHILPVVPFDGHYDSSQHELVRYFPAGQDYVHGKIRSVEMPGMRIGQVVRKKAQIGAMQWKDQQVQDSITANIPLVESIETDSVAFDPQFVSELERYATLTGEQLQRSLQDELSKAESLDRQYISLMDSLGRIGKLLLDLLQQRIPNLNPNDVGEIRTIQMRISWPVNPPSQLLPISIYQDAWRLYYLTEKIRVEVTKSLEQHHQITVIIPTKSDAYDSKTQEISSVVPTTIREQHNTVAAVQMSGMKVGHKVVERARVVVYGFSG